MNTQEIKAKINLLKSEIEVKRLEIESLNNELDEQEWMVISWTDLENWLKENGKESRFNNPRVKTTRDKGYDREYQTYCYLSEEPQILGQLIIGGYYYNDRFKRGKDVMVKKDFEPYRK